MVRRKKPSEDSRERSFVILRETNLAGIKMCLPSREN